jgi:hypothetical protein
MYSLGGDESRTARRNLEPRWNTEVLRDEQFVMLFKVQATPTNKIG